MSTAKPKKKRLLRSLWQAFTQSSSKSSIVLGLAALASILIANSGWAPGYFKILETHIGGSPLGLHLDMSVSHWINDGLMAFFFLLVGMEIKRELMEGELSTIKQAMLPIFGAIGGMVLPALIYTFFNFGTPVQRGWGVPMATDIAFSLAVVSALGKRVPLSVKVFLTALAIVDDLGAILVIALFYTQGMLVSYLLWAGGACAVLLVFNQLKVRALWPYVLVGAVLWYCIHQSGVHATVAGVLLAFLMPLGRYDDGPAERLQGILDWPVGFLVMPLFALANTGFHISAESLAGLHHPLSYGILFGLVLGKPFGIIGFSMLGILLGFAKFPKGAGVLHFLGAGCLAGIGYTVAIFIALLAFPTEASQAIAKLSILVASILAALVGVIVFKLAPIPKPEIAAPPLPIREH